MITMNSISITRSPNFFNRLTTLFLGFCIALLLLTAIADAQDEITDQIDGFTEPFRSIELSSDETGSISVLNVEEGETVNKDDVVAKLDVRVQEIQLEIATNLANTTSGLVAAEETLKKRREISRRLQQLKDRGHASHSEIIRSEMELSIAEAKYLSAQEDLTVREIERRRAKVQLDRRTIVAPFGGLVAKVHRREGEFLSPLHPEVVTIIQVDKLLATFPVPSTEVDKFEMGKEYPIEMENGTKTTGKVYRKSVQTDAQSGTVEIKLVIENASMELRSGEICTLSNK